MLPTRGYPAKGLAGYRSLYLFSLQRGYVRFVFTLSPFEFEEVDETTPTIKLAHELQAGRRYSVIVSTGGDLYRSRLNDLIEVAGFYNQCPLLRFVGRQSKVVDICGEK